MMDYGRTLAGVLWAAVVCAIGGGCTDYAREVENNRQTLLVAYPVETTSGGDVRKAMARPTKFAATRPVEGWYGERLPGVEKRAGHGVYSYECYVVPNPHRTMWEALDGRAARCSYWFFYDERERVVDAEWDLNTY
jgi:hypothetical protein